MNRELKGLMTKFEINQAMIAGWLGISVKSVNTKINKCMFRQKEMIRIVDKLKEYDSSIQMDIFYFPIKLDH